MLKLRFISLMIFLLVAPVLMAQMTQIISDARYSGLSGLRVMIAESPAFVEDSSPDGESRYRARFYVNPSGATLFDGDAFDIFSGNDLDMHRWFRLELARVGSSLVYRLHGLENGLSYQTTTTTAVPNVYHMVELDFSSAGKIDLWVENKPVLGLSGLNNSQGSIDLIQLGAVDGMDIDSTGHLDFDNFVSNQGEPIGPLNCTPPETFFEALASWPDGSTVLDLLPMAENLCLN